MGLLGGLLGIGSSAIDAGIGMATAKKQYQYQRSLNQQQDDYNTQMSNTQYQRGTQDMLKAGLNPALMFKSGGPDTASASSGGNAPDVSRAVGHPASSALHSIIQQNTAKQLQATTATAEATADKTKAEASLLKANTANQLAKTAQEVHQLRAQTDLTKSSRVLNNQREAILHPDEQRARVLTDWEGIPTARAYSQIIGEGLDTFNKVLPFKAGKLAERIARSNHNLRQRALSRRK